MPRPPRKKPPKFDYHALNDEAVARPPSEAEARLSTKAWLADEANIDRLLELVSSGQSLRRFCEQTGIAYSPVQRALTSPELEPRYRAAQQEQAEHLVGEMERITAKLESGELDPKAGSVILDNLKWRASKFNLRYNDRQVIEQHTFDHTQAHIDAVRQLARMTRVVQVGDGHTKPALVHQADTVPMVSHMTPVPAQYVPVPAKHDPAAPDAPGEPGTPVSSKDDPGSPGQPGQPGTPVSSRQLPSSPVSSSASSAGLAKPGGAEPADDVLEGEVIPR